VAKDLKEQSEMRFTVGKFGTSLTNNKKAK
jgi:hypothetical protein